MQHGLGERAQRGVAAPRTEQVEARRLGLAGAFVVVADAGGAVGARGARLLREHVGEAAMQGSAPLAHELGVGAAAHDVVTEVVLAPRRRGHEAARHEQGERVGAALRDRRLHLGQQLGLEGLAQHRGGLQQALRVGRQRIDARGDHGVEGLGDPLPGAAEGHFETRRVPRRGRAVAQRPRDLLDEERVAPAAQTRQLDQIGRVRHAGEQGVGQGPGLGQG